MWHIPYIMSEMLPYEAHQIISEECYLEPGTLLSPGNL